MTNLVGAGKAFVTAGLSVDKYLKSADDLAAANKDAGVTALDTARVFARLKSGDFGEAFERLRDFGINRQELEAKGLKFDNGGSFKGEAQQAIDAVVGIITDKFGGLSEKLSTETFDGAMSAVQDNFTRLAVSIGEQLLPALTTAAQWFSNLQEKFVSLPEGTKKMIAFGLAAVAGILIIGGGLLTLIGTLGIGLLGLAAAAGAAGAGAGAGAIGLSALLVPLGIFLAVVLAIVAAGYLAYKAWGWLKDKWDDFNKPLETVAAPELKEDERDAALKKVEDVEKDPTKGLRERAEAYRVATEELKNAGAIDEATLVANKRSNLLKENPQFKENPALGVSRYATRLSEKKNQTGETIETVPTVPAAPTIPQTPSNPLDMSAIIKMGENLRSQGQVMLQSNQNQEQAPRGGGEQVITTPPPQMTQQSNGEVKVVIPGFTIPAPPIQRSYNQWEFSN